MKERRNKILFNEIIGKILNYIEKRKMKNGDKFPPEKELADLFQISRLTLREALKALEALRVIEIRHGVGIFLRDSQVESSVESLFYKLFSAKGLTKKEFMDILEVRNMIEQIAVKLAVKNIKDSNLIRLESFLNTMEKNLEVGINNMEVDTLFHMEIAIASQNFVLTRIIKTIENLTRKVRFAYLDNEENALNSHKQHIKIYNALKEHNLSSATEMMIEHLKNVDDEFIDYILKINNK